MPWHRVIIAESPHKALVADGGRFLPEFGCDIEWDIPVPFAVHMFCQATALKSWIAKVLSCGDKLGTKNIEASQSDTVVIFDVTAK